MKIQVLQEDLIKVLSNSIRFINTKSTLPILGNFLLIAEKTNLKIQATNLEISISAQIGAKVEEEGRLTVPAKTFLELISNISQGQLNLTQEKEELKIVGNGFKASVPTIPSNDFPIIPENINLEQSFPLTLSDLTKSLTKILFSASLDERRPVLTGILFIFNDDKLTLVASDGFRLSRKTIKLTKKVETRNVIIPKPTLLELIKLAGSIQEVNCELKKDENQLVIKIGDTYLASRLIEGEFPNFEKIIPTSSTTTVTVGKGDFSRGVSLASVFAKESANVIKLAISENSMKILSENGKTGQQVNDIEAKVIGPALEASFNFNFIKDFLSVVEGEDLEIKLTDSNSASIFEDPRDKEFLHLIMPVRVQS